jgi:aryl-alcohol dehydrogenase-like predicted oxidoreductase
MKFRRFGRTGWQVGEIGYGMWGMAGWSGSQDAESLASLQRAIDLGCNFFDTAWAYGDGHSEELLGKALRANPNEKLYVATKVPPKNRCWPSKREFSLEVSYPPEYVFEYVEKSLHNIGVENIDLFQYHTWEDKWLFAHHRKVARERKSARRRNQHEPLGTLERNSRREVRTSGCGPGHLQHL